MKTLSCCVLGFSLAMCTVCFGQIDIYQSDAYSVEEMCAREAEQEQDTLMNYPDAYEACIGRNRENPMYRAERGGADSQSADTNNADGQTNAYGEDRHNPDSSHQDLENY
jgi:hypothetical protein